MNPQKNHSASASPPPYEGLGAPRMSSSPNPNRVGNAPPPYSNAFQSRSFGTGLTVHQAESANFNYVFGQPGTYNVRVSLAGDASAIHAAAAGLAQATTNPGVWGRGQVSGWGSNQGDGRNPAIMDQGGHHHHHHRHGRVIDPRELAHFQTLKEFPGLTPD